MAGPDIKTSTLLLGVMGLVMVFVGIVLYANAERLQAHVIY